MVFIFMKVLMQLLLPPSGILILIVAGFLLLRSHRIAGRLFIACGFLLLYLLSIGPVADALIRPLEASYPPLKEEPVRAKTIVVLGGGVNDLSWIGLASEPAEASRARLIAGIKLHRSLHLPLIFSGGSGDPRNPAASDAEAMGREAMALGFSDRDLTLETKSRNTLENAKAVRNILNGGRIILVTSASHMRRAAAMFRAQGFEVLPAPTAYISEQLPFTFYSLIPQAGTLSVSCAALYEYLSLAWYGIRGDLQDNSPGLKQ